MITLLDVVPQYELDMPVGMLRLLGLVFVSSVFGEFVANLCGVGSNT